MRATFLTWLPLASAAVINSFRLPRDTSPLLGLPDIQPRGQCTVPGSAIPLSAPASAPSDASVVPGDFVGFGFDSAFLDNYGNTFSQNLINSIAERIPGPIILRVGGTSGDRTLFDPNQKNSTVCVGGDCPIGAGASYIIGPSYFEGFKKFPNQLFSFQAPMNETINKTNVVDIVTRSYKAIGANRVAAIALGNEPDLYASASGTNYTAQDYVTNATLVEKIVIKALDLDENTPIFESPDIAGYGNFDLVDVYEAGLNNNGLIKYAAEHWYQLLGNPADDSPATEQAVLMNHSAITGLYTNMSYYNAIDYINANDSGVSYILSETGSALAGPPRYFQDAFGATLWLLDFQFYSMSIGVKRIDNTQRPSANHSLWVPDKSATGAQYGDEANPGPQVRAPWFGTPMVADFIGMEPGPVVALLGDDEATAYAIYNSSSSSSDNGPSRVAIVNLKYWSSNQKTSRGHKVFSIPVQGSQNVTLSRLHAAMGARAQGYDVQGDPGIITWAGETWSYKLDHGNGHYTNAPKTETVKVCNGTAVVTVPDSEAVMVFLSG